MFKVELHSNACGVLFGGPNQGEQVEISVDGERKAILNIDPRMAETTTGLSLKTPPMHIKAGVRRVTAACIQRFEGAWNDPNAPYYGGLQMDMHFQRLYGGYLLRRKGTADRWSPLEQMWFAWRAHRSGRGFYPWPNTARACGLI